MSKGKTPFFVKFQNSFFYRWRTCVGDAKGSLANAVGSMYVQKYFKQDSKQAALEMVADIRTEFYKILDEVRSMHHLLEAFSFLDFLLL